jgi:hypothetical protein
MRQTPPRAAAARMARQVQGYLLPVRRMLSRAVLVYEEAHFRDVAVDKAYRAAVGEVRKVRDEMRGLEERVVLRVDILMEELWRRTEGVGARQATEIQRLAARLNDVAGATPVQMDELRRLSVQMAEVHQLAAQVAELRMGPPAGREGAPWARHRALLDGLEPIGDLDMVADPTGYLGSLGAGSLGGAACSHRVHLLAPGAQKALMNALAQALRAGGVGVFAVAGPAQTLAAAAVDCGLIAEEARADHMPAQLAAVGTGLTDPALREIAEGLNALVDQLNRARDGNEAGVLVVRKP